MGVFLLSPDGRVLGFSGKVAEWWSLAGSQPGRPFVEFFLLGAAGDDPEMSAAAWLALIESAGAGPVPLQARVPGTSGFETQARLVQLVAGGVQGGWVAEVRRTGPTRSALAPAVVTDRSAWEWSGLEDSGVGLFHLDLKGGTARFSPGWKRMLGYGEGDLSDEPDALTALLHPEDSEAAPQANALGMADARTGFSCEVRLRGRDGDWRWTQLEGVRQFDHEGQLAAITGIMLDVQDRRELEDEALRNDARFRRLTSRGKAGFFELELTSDEAWFSPEFRHALGWRTDELPATVDAFQQLLAPEEAEAGVEAFFDNLIRSSDGPTKRYRLRHADGRLGEFEAFVAAERDRHGNLVRVMALQMPAADGARQPVAKAETIPGEDPFAVAARQALDAVAECVVLVDRDGYISFANARATHAAGRAADALKREPWNECFPLIERTAGVTAPEVISRVLGGGPALELDHGYLLGVGETRAEVVITCRPLFDVRQKPAGAIVIFRKPSEMPLSPVELLASNRMEALGRLACGIAHDFNNLLTTVTGGISLASEKREWSPLDVAQKACGTAKNLARQLLTFARGDTAGKRIVSINDTIRETSRMAGAGSKTTIELELASDVHPVSIDPAQFIQVFTNLILNAMQVMPGGGRIWIRSLNMPLGQVNSVSLPPGDYVRIDVQDNGPGIPPENLERIFEPFFTTRPDGTGLGLPMVRSIIAQHEGAIEVVSTVGSGTTFTLYLPRAQAEAVHEPTRPAVVSYGSGRVLLMDDDPDLCMIASGMLEMLGYEPQSVQTAADAILAYRRSRELGQHFAAVILDLTMAGSIGGEEVLTQLREIDPSVRAIVSSGYATEEHTAHYRKIGFTGMLAKPYRSADLGRVLKEVIATGK
jgi:two-component system, cell cycle sensor histidine kinase and response regulator CckA